MHNPTGLCVQTSSGVKSKGRNVQFVHNPTGLCVQTSSGVKSKGINVWFVHNRTWDISYYHTRVRPHKLLK